MKKGNKNWSKKARGEMYPQQRHYIQRVETAEAAGCGTHTGILSSETETGR